MVIAIETVVPVRSEASEGAEQLTQLLYGEECEVLERVPRWTRVRSLRDGQEGWVDFKMVQDLPDEIAKKRLLRPYAVVIAPLTYAVRPDGEKLPLCAGTRLYDYCNGVWHEKEKIYILPHQDIAESILPFSEQTILSLANAYRHIPYLWAGKNACGMDCSGFTQVLYEAFGVHLLRNAREQITQGQPIPSLSEARVGDLLFFDHADRDPAATSISHVGLYVGLGRMLHASGCIHEVEVTEEGAFHADGHQTHHLVGIRRYLSE